MKSSLIRNFVIFTAGAATAGTAALAASYYPEPISVGQFHERVTVLLAEVEALGVYVAVAEKGRVGIFTNPGAACIPPVPPLPVLPAYAVDLRTLESSLKALKEANVGFLMGNKEPVYEVIDKCKPVEGMTIKEG